MKRITLALLALAACKTDPTPSASPSESPPAPVDTTRALALDVPEAKTRVDRILNERKTNAVRRNSNADMWILLGRAWVRKARESSDPGFYMNARAAADVALELSPDSIPARNLKGLVMLNAHRFEEARDLARALHARYPDDAMALGTLADALVELGDYEGASEAVAKMLRIKPNLPSYSRAAYLRWIAGDVTAAKEAIRLAFDAGRGQRDREPATWTLVEAADMFFNTGDYEGAEAGYDLALSYFPGYPGALVGKGRVAMARNQPSAAAGHFESAFARSPLATTAWLLHDARLAVGDAEGAARASADVERIGRQGDTRTLAAFYAAHDQATGEAVRLAKKDTTARKNVQSMDTLAWALYRAGRVKEAKAASDLAMRLGTQDATLLYHRGAILIASGEPSSGRDLIQKALDLNPSFDYTGAREAKEIIDATNG